MQPRLRGVPAVGGWAPSFAENRKHLTGRHRRGRGPAATVVAPPLIRPCAGADAAVGGIAAGGGGGLDEPLARAAYIVTASDIIRVQTFGELTQRTLGAQELQQEIAVCAALLCAILGRRQPDGG